MGRNREEKSLDEAREQWLSGMGAPEGHVFKVDSFQQDAIESIAEGNDTLVVAPTGSGKTYIAFEAISTALGCRTKAVYTTPLKALSNTKFTELKKRFEPEYKVGLLTGDRKIDTDADVVVATTEIYRNELYKGEGRFSVVVLDEVHFISDLQRGPVWEESIILTPSSASLLMLSASISNAEEIADWLLEVRGKPCKIIEKKDRPVELRFGFLHPDVGITPLYQGSSVFPEVSQYYDKASLDHSGMRLRGGRFSRDQRGSGKGRERRDGGKNFGGSGGSSRRSKNRGSGRRRR